MSRKLSVKDLEYLAIGAAVLGTGGGGDPKIGYLMAKQAIEKYGEIDLVSVDELDDDQLVGCVSMMGAPSVSLEKIPNGQEFVHVLETMENLVGKKVTAVYPIEVGGLNSLIPIAAAAALRVPLIDADCMGRAFPELQMVTQTIFGIDNTPMILCDEKLNTIIADVKKPKEMEKFLRSVTMAAGGSAITAEGFVDVKTFKIFGIQDIVSLSYDIGYTIKHSNDPLSDLVNKYNAFHLFDGKITDILRAYDGGFNKGHVFIDGINNDDKYEVYVQNENLVAYKNSKPITMVPDLICILDMQTLMPITTEKIKFGQRVTVIAFKADEKWRLEKGIELTGPRAFGYDFDYVEVEKLVGDSNEV